ncbi:hypothetical protein [Schlesneria sp. DSM 10557]|uniref:hypothetical protein n=1 Tax=Schlesneria sp. DSM 10557 TaxID=3044399 RepID=UPI00359FC82A
MSRPLVADGLLTKSIAMPTGASAVTTPGIPLDQTANGDFVAFCELEFTAPALTTGMLGDAATVIYAIVTGASVDANGVIQSPTVIANAVLTQTGAGGAGAATSKKRFRLPTDVVGYVGVRATKSASGDASSVSLVAKLLF